MEYLFFCLSTIFFYSGSPMAGLTSDAILYVCVCVCLRSCFRLCFACLCLWICACVFTLFECVFACLCIHSCVYLCSLVYVSSGVFDFCVCMCLGIMGWISAFIYVLFQRMQISLSSVFI